MTKKVKYFLLTIVILSSIKRLTAKDIVEETLLDNSAFVRSLFRSFRKSEFRFFKDYELRLNETTSGKSRGKFLQEPIDKFPCDLRGMRSEKVPTSVHRLKPGKCRERACG